jgi:preprotein translocase subunit YajC
MSALLAFRKVLAMFHTLLVLAQAPEGGAKPFPIELLLLPALFILFYFIVLRPNQRRQQQERDSLLTGTKKNDEVITTSGIYGTVISVSDTKDEVVVKVDDGTRLRMLKSSIMRNLTQEEAAKAAKDAKNPKKEAEKASTGIRKA